MICIVSIGFLRNRILNLNGNLVIDVYQYLVGLISSTVYIHSAINEHLTEFCCC